MAAKIRCPQCGKLVKRSLRYCDQCGSDLSTLAETTPGARRSGSLPFVLGVVITLLVIAVGFIVLMLTGVIRTGDGDVPAIEAPQPTAQITDVPPAGPTPTVMSTPAPTPEPDRSAEFYNSGLAAGIEQATATYEPQLAAQYQEGLADGFAQAASTYEPQLSEQYQAGLANGIAEAASTYEPQLSEQYQAGLNAGVAQAKATFEPQLAEYQAQIEELSKPTPTPKPTPAPTPRPTATPTPKPTPTPTPKSTATDDPNMAISLVPDTSYLVNINRSGQTKWCLFKPEISGNYTLYSSGSMNPRVALCELSLVDDHTIHQSAPLAEDDDSGERYNFSLTYPLEAGTAYVFEIRMASAAATGSFSVRFESGPDGILEADTSYLININHPGQTKTYRFTPASSGTYTLYSLGIFDTEVILSDRSGRLASDDNGGQNGNFHLSYNLTAGTTYTYTVRLSNPEATGSFSFRLASH